MKYLIYSFLSLFFFISCQAQKSSTYSIKNDNYEIDYIKGVRNNTDQIDLFRKKDSLRFEITIEPSLNRIFERVAYLEKSERILMRIVKTKEIGDYRIDQLNFILSDGRNISLHNASDDLFNIDLNKFNIRVKNCFNCSDKIAFLLYEK